MTFKGLPIYEGKKIIHKFINNIEYKWCGGILCLDKYSNEGIWKTLDKFNKCNPRWDKLETMCRKCKNFNRSAERKKEKKLELDILGPKKINNKKKCTKCSQYKENEEFSKNARYKDGLDSRCRICKNGKKGNRIGKASRAIHTIIDGKEGKVCTGCKKWKSFEDKNFKKEGKYKDETQRYASHCKLCINIKDRERYKENNNKLSDNELLERKIQKSVKIRSVSKKDGKLGKICSNKFHKKWLPIEEFNNDSREYVDGEIKYKNHCKKCRKYDRKIKRARISIIKELDFNINRELYLKNYIRPELKNGNKCVKHNKFYWLCFLCYPYDNIKFNEKQRIKRQNNTLLRLKQNLHHRVYLALKNNNCSYNSKELIGCDIEEYWKYLKPLMKEGMTKENYGSIWHIDHIKPVSLFNLKILQEQRKAFNYKNTQPMFGVENIRKSNNYTFNIVHEIMLYNI